MRGYILKLLVTALLLLLGVESEVYHIHYHGDGKLHPDCGLCLIQYNPQKREYAELKLKAPQVSEFYIKIPDILFSAYTPPAKHTYQRAPPV